VHIRSCISVPMRDDALPMIPISINHWGGIDRYTPSEQELYNAIIGRRSHFRAQAALIRAKSRRDVSRGSPPHRLIKTHGASEMTAYMGMSI
jgi:hypothetical protein